MNILLLATFDQLGNANTKFAALYSERPFWTYDESDSRRAKAKKKQHSSDDEDHESSRPVLTLARAKGMPKKEKPARVTKRQKRTQRTSPPPTPAELKASLAQTNVERLQKRLESSPEYKALYIAVARIFASKLVEEVSLLKELSEKKLEGEEKTKLLWQIGLASKWAPTIGASHDRYTNIATAISLVLHNLGAMSELGGSASLSQPPTSEDVLKVRSFYRRWIVSPLRRQIQVPEQKMSADAWSAINYNCVPALCMRNSKRKFMEHDLERFEKYLKDVAKGEKTIAGATLLPHQLLGEALSYSGYLKGTNVDGNPTAKEAEINLQVVEGQWKALVDRLKESGALDNCMALCDVSGSMGSIDYISWNGGPTTASHLQQFNQPIFPAVALSIILSLLARPPFAHTFITFSHTPEIVQLKEEWGLVETAQHMVTTSWGMNTDLQAVFMKLILPLAVKNKVKQVRVLFLSYSELYYSLVRRDETKTLTCYCSDRRI